MGSRITALKVQQRNPRRISVYLDGEYAFGLERITAAWLKVGQELSDQKIDELKNQDSLEMAYRKALRFLENRPRTESEIRKHLEKKGTREEILDQVIERLKENGLVNDEQFAALWIENRSEFRPRSRKALSIEMRQRGVSSEVIEKALDGYKGKEEEMAYRAAVRPARRYQNLEKIEFRRKLYGFLARRGFGYEIITSVVERIWNELNFDKENEGLRKLR